MGIFRIPLRHVFPDPNQADASGLLGVGGDLDPRRITLAYRLGIFPWFSEGQPILWWSPDPRMVLAPQDLRVGRSLRKRINQRPYRVTMDHAFSRVIRHCARIGRPNQDGTWITEDMVQAYEALHAAGFAHSVETWDGDELVGGLYGVAVGAVFCGESMFALAPDASKIAFVLAVRRLEEWGFKLVDCQVYTEHLARFGAHEVPRAEFLSELAPLVYEAVEAGPWRTELEPGAQSET